MKLKRLRRLVRHVLFVFFIPLCCRVVAAALDSLGRNAPRGGRMYCDTCERRIVRIPPQEHLRQGKLHPQCPRCGNKAEPLPPLMTRKLAIRLLRRKSDLSACSIRLLEDVARRSNGLSRQEARMKSMIETILDSRSRQTSTQKQPAHGGCSAVPCSASEYRGSRCPICFWALYDGDWCQGPKWCANRGKSVEKPIRLTNAEAMEMIHHYCPTCGRHVPCRHCEPNAQRDAPI